ncbi:hypothetical protein [Anaeromyxobacter oryzisoli]|uniref:hypothetical protein n=1 Tax=Anaeromyxobacter oryzisoli TaxID=2925408 RepID=UPI001F579902|nr:hypothetical protein [Anaeromyxobacter sp. SG63]
MNNGSKKLNPHHDFPLRRIVRREMQNGHPAVVMACGHTVLGRPESRYSRFFPCSRCYEVVVRFRAEQATAKAATGPWPAAPRGVSFPQRVRSAG